MQRVSAVPVMAAMAAVFFLSCLVACGGSSTANTTATQLILNPTTFSLNQGAVGTLSVTAENSAGTIVPADITFTSSNTSVATVSTGGLICAGQWDSVFINCTPNGGVGQVTITATSNNNITGTATAYIHEQVDQVQAVLANNCTSMGQAVSVSGQAFSTTAPGCSLSAPCNITSTVGPFAFGSNDTTIVASSSGIVSTFNSTTNSPTYSSGGTISGTSGQTCNLSNFVGVNGATATVALTSANTIASGTHLTITAPGSGGTTPPTTATLSNGSATCSGTATVITSLTNGVLTAEVPGVTTVFASVSGVNSVGAPYETCRVAQIMVTNATSGQTSFTLNPGGTQPLTADVYDSTGRYITPTLAWGSSSTAAATVAASGSVSNPGTITAVAPGTAYITASCSFPSCNRFVPAQYSQNIVTATVTGTTGTLVYAASTNSLMLVPFNIATDTPGTAITLPAYPNSIAADPAGVSVYLGTNSSGLMAVNVSSGGVTTYAVNGPIVAVSPDGQYLLISDPAGAVRYFDVATPAVTGSAPGYTTTSSAYTPDSQSNQWINGTNLGVGLQSAFSGLVSLGYTANALDISAPGGLTYITSASSREINVLSTCNQAENPTLPANAPTLIAKLPNGTGAVAADPPDIDVVTTPLPYNAGCPVTTQSTLVAYPLVQTGSFTAQQIFVTSDSTRAWIVSDLPELLTFDLSNLTPATVALTGSPTPYNGGVTLDGANVYVGTSDGTVHRISTSAMADITQIPVSLKDANGNVTPPNLVVVVP